LEKKQNSAILEVYFRFRCRPYHYIGDVILHQAVEFHPNRTIFGRVMMFYRFSRWRTLRLTSPSSERQRLSAVSLNPRLSYNYFRFGKTNVRHIGIFLPVATSSIS